MIFGKDYCTEHKKVVEILKLKKDIDTTINMLVKYIPKLKTLKRSDNINTKTTTLYVLVESWMVETIEKCNKQKLKQEKVMAKKFLKKILN